MEVLRKINGTRCGSSKVCGRQPLKNFTRFILEYFVPNGSFESWKFIREIKYWYCKRKTDYKQNIQKEKMKLNYKIKPSKACENVQKIICNFCIFDEFVAIYL